MIKSGADSWGENNLNEYNSQNSKFDANEKKGPLTLAVYATQTSGANQMGLIVIGNDLFATDNAFQYTQSSGNVDFIMNALGTLNGTPQSVTIRPRAVVEKPLMLTASGTRNLFILLVIILPGAVLLAGLIVWLRRRHL